MAWNGVARIEMIKSEKATFAMYMFVTVCIDLKTNHKLENFMKVV